jgi:RNA-directed DNA polymerase
MPIGNLTSQLFANIYLNEFDRFVRHRLQPLGYVRYGDDFLLVTPDQALARSMQSLVSAWIQSELHLTVHSENEGVFKASHGIHFLGHRIYPNSVAIERAMERKI